MDTKQKMHRLQKYTTLTSDVQITIPQQTSNPEDRTTGSADITANLKRSTKELTREGRDTGPKGETGVDKEITVCM